MSKDKVEFAVDMVKQVLDNDKDYPEASLKLGAIWYWCNWAAEFRQGESAVEVTPRRE